MDAGRVSLPSSSSSVGDEGRREGTTGPPECPVRLFTMQGMLSDIQEMVERSAIINRTRTMGLTCLRSCESEVRLTRAVSRALSCRYQPAQLSVVAMLKQLEEAKEYRRCVQEQVAHMKCGGACGESHDPEAQDPEALRTAEERWGVALLDAAATVQVKAAQLDQVTRYDNQTMAIRSFLERLAGEMDTLSLDVLGSSTVQAERIGALLRTMQQQRAMMKELLHSSGELAPHLREAESSGVLPAQLGSLQEDWRLLEGAFKRALRHASAASSHSSHLLKMAQHLQARVMALQEACAGLPSCGESHGGPSCLTLNLTCLRADLEIHHQHYLHIQSQLDTLCQFSLGQKEREDIGCVLQDLQRSLIVTKSQLEERTPGILWAPVPMAIRPLEDLARWAKDAENQFATGQLLALFPEEARIQMAEMRKLRYNTLSKQLQFKSLVIDADENNSEVLNSLKKVKELYEAFGESSALVLEHMERTVQEREDLFHQLTSLDSWLSDTNISKTPLIHIENASKVEMLQLERQLGLHKLATEKIENKIAQVDILIKYCRKIALELNPAESRYLVNRLSGLWTELDGLLAHEHASSWELEELIHERTSSNDELASIQASLKQISADLDCQTFPLTAAAVSAATRMMHMLTEHQFQVQELQHCHETKRCSLLCDIGELQDKCKALTVHATEQDKYFHLLKEMEKSQHIAEGQIKRSCTQAASLSERFQLCQTLLVELPLVKTQCQEVADQLEVIAQNLDPAQLKSERWRIQHMVETLVAWEHAVTANIQNLESRLLEGLHLCTELPTMMDHVQRTRQELLAFEPVDPEEKAIDAALQRCWVILRNLESWMRVVEALGKREKWNLRTHEELKSLTDACMHDYHSQMESLAHAREALKDYRWAAQGAISFLHNAEATFLSAPGGFLDCGEEQKQTRQALASLKDVLQAHISHLVELVPHQPCVSGEKTQELHIRVLSHLLVGRAMLEAQARLRLEALERCARTQQSHWMDHKRIRQLLSSFEASLSQCSSERITSYFQCDAQQSRVKALMSDLHGLAGRLEELRAGCPMQGCRAGEGGQLSALWRHWASLCRGVGLLLAQSRQRGAEWADITASMEHCCSSLAGHQEKLPGSSSSSVVPAGQGDPGELLSWAKTHQAGLQQEQQSLASLEHRLEHALSLSGPQDPGSPGPTGQMLVTVQSARSMKEQNELAVRAALAEDQAVRRAQEEILEVEEQVALLQSVESGSSRRQGGMGHVKLEERSDPLQELSSRVLEVSEALEELKTLLDSRSPSFPEAQETLKRVWDGLDLWHSRLSVLESEAQDLAEERPQQGQVLMDRLSGPLRLYQDAAKQAEQRTTFLARIPAFLQEFEDILHSATCWLREAQSWVSAPCTYTTARSLHSHAKSLQLVVEDSVRTRATLGSLGPLVQAISAVWDTRKMEQRLVWTERQVEAMQHSVYIPLELLLHTAMEIDAMELEVKTMEKNVMKIRTILSSMSTTPFSEVEHLHSQQVILANLQSMQKTLEEIQQCKGELGLPAGALGSLTVFPRAEQLLQALKELQELTQEEDALQDLQEDELHELEALTQEQDALQDLQNKDSSEEAEPVGHGGESCDLTDGSSEQTWHGPPPGTPHRGSEEEEEGEEDEDGMADERSHSSSSDTLTCSLPEDPEESFMNLQDMEVDADAAKRPGEAELGDPGPQPLQEDPAPPGGVAWRPWPAAAESEPEAGLSLLLGSRPVFDTEAGLVATVDQEEVLEIRASLGRRGEGEDVPKRLNPDAMQYRELGMSNDDEDEEQEAENEEDELKQNIVELPAVNCTGTGAAWEQVGEGPEQTGELQESQQGTMMLQELPCTMEREVGMSHTDSLLWLVEDFDDGQIESQPTLKQWLEGPSEAAPEQNAELRRVACSFLSRLSCVLDLAEERMRTWPPRHARSQHLLSTSKKFLQVLGVQVSVGQHLFRREPDALGGAAEEEVEADWARLESRARVALERALEQEVTSHGILKVRSEWEAGRGRMGTLLEELDAVLSVALPERKAVEEEEVYSMEEVHARLRSCQGVLAQLEQSRPALGCLLDQGRLLCLPPQPPAGAEDSTSVGPAGGALELLWRSVHRRTEQEIGRCWDLQQSWTRLQSESQSLGEWLTGVRGQLEAWCGLADGPAAGKENTVHSHLTQLLDFSMEVEARAAQKATIAREGALLLGLREADSPWLRGLLSALEVTWSQTTSDLARAQEQLQQLLIPGWPPTKLLSDLRCWVEKMEARLGKEKVKALQATDAAQLSDTLQHLQEVKVGVACGQVLLDFLWESGPQKPAQADICAFSWERTLFAENLGGLGSSWASLQGELMTQIRMAEAWHHVCARREVRLGRLRPWLTRESDEVARWQRPVSWMQAHKALLESQALEERGKEVRAALQELRDIRVFEAEGPQQETDQTPDHPSDQVFSGQIDEAAGACVALTQKVGALRPALRHILDQWSRLETGLSDLSLHTTRQRCALQQLLNTPAFSPAQARQHLEELQRLQEDAGKWEGLCAAVDQSYQSLEGKVDEVTARLLAEQIEEERGRGQQAALEVQQALRRTEQALDLWQSFAGKWDGCAVGVERAWRRWEELAGAPPARHPDTRTCGNIAEDFFEDLGCSGAGLEAAAQPLVALLQPLAANQIQAEVATLSRDLLLVVQSLSREKARLQEDLELHHRLSLGLGELEFLTPGPANGPTTGAQDLESAEETLRALSGRCQPLMELSELALLLQAGRGEASRLDALWGRWAAALTHTAGMIRERTVTWLGLLSFQQKAERLEIIRREVEEALESTHSGSPSSLLKRLAAHQRVTVDLVRGQWSVRALLQDSEGLLSDAGAEERAAVLARLQDSWQQDCVAGAAERRARLREELAHWRAYRVGSRRLWRVLPGPPGGTPCRLRCSYDSAEHLEEVLAPVYRRTLDAGRKLCASMTTTESADREQLSQELRSLEEAWEQTGRSTALVHTALQERSLFGDRLSLCGRQLDDLQLRLEEALDTSNPEEIARLTGESEASLGRVRGALGELDGARTDLWRRAEDGRTALMMEGQVELMHQHWEELCLKVATRRQEITDRLNAWTNFSDSHKELCDWLSSMEGEMLHRDKELDLQELVDSLQKDCVEEMRLFSENKQRLQQLGEQLLQASHQAGDQPRHGPVHVGLQEVDQRWHKLFHLIQTRVRKLKETLRTVQQLDQKMSGLRSWLAGVEARLHRPTAYSTCQHQEIQNQLAHNQELQRDVEEHMEGVASVLSLCDALHADAAAGGEGDSLLDASRSLDQRWRAVCSLAQDRRLGMEETWRLWCQFLDDYGRFEDWLKMAERTAARPNSSDVPYTVAKEELKKFESFQRQVDQRLTQLELVNSQYRRLARENRTDRASQLRALVHQGNRRWDVLQRRVAAILRRLKHFTGQREAFEGTRESVLVWLMELDLQLTTVEHFSQSHDRHRKMEQLNDFHKEIGVNAERLDGLIVSGERLIQRSSPLDGAAIEEELEELHTYCQQVFSRLVRSHQRLSTAPEAQEEPFYDSVSLEDSLELIGRPWLGRGSLPATPTHLLSSPMERSGRGTPVSVDSLPLEWDHTGDVGGSSTHEEEEEEEEEEGMYFSVLSDLGSSESEEEEFVDVAGDWPLDGSVPAPSRSMVVKTWSAGWQTDDEVDASEPPATLLTSTPQKHSYLRLMSECSGSSEDLKRVSVIQDREEQLEAAVLTGPTSTDTQPAAMEHWMEASRVQSRINLPPSAPQEPRNLVTPGLADEMTSWLGRVVTALELRRRCDPATSIQDLEAGVRHLKETQQEFSEYRSRLLEAGGLRGSGEAVDGGGPEGGLLGELDQVWVSACASLQAWEDGLRTGLMRSQEFHGALHSTLLWLAEAESTCRAVDVSQPHALLRSLQQHHSTLSALQADLRSRQMELRCLQALWSQLQPRHGPAEEGWEAQEKLHVSDRKLRSLLREVDGNLSLLQRRLDCQSVISYSAEGFRGGGGGGGRDHIAFAASAQEEKCSRKQSSKREARSPPAPPPSCGSFFQRVLWTALPLHLLLLLLLLLCFLLPGPASDPGCSRSNSLARSFHPMLCYPHGPPPT